MIEIFVCPAHCRVPDDRCRTTVFSPGLRKKIKDPCFPHPPCAYSAVACGLVHGLIYMLYLR
jgi:hypothetical protein